MSASTSQPTVFQELGQGLTEFPYIIPLAMPSRLAVAGPCVVSRAELVGYSGYRSAEIDEQIHSQYSYDWLEASLDASLTARAKLFSVTVASAGIDTHFRAANINTKVSYTSSTQFSAALKTAYLKSFRATSDVEPLLNALNTAYAASRSAPTSAARAEGAKLLRALLIPFYLRCGDRFVDQAVLGAKFGSSLHVNFTDNRSLLDFMVKATAKIAKQKRTFKHDEHFDRQFSGAAVEVDLFQEGGDQAAFAQFKTGLGAGSAGGLARNTCFVDKQLEFQDTDDFLTRIQAELDGCYNAWNASNAYIRKEFYRQIATGPVEQLVPQKNHWLTYYEAGLLDFKIVLPAGVQNKLVRLNQMFKTLAKLRMILDNATQAVARTSAGLTLINSEWQNNHQQFASTLELVTSDIDLMTSAVTSCVDAIRNETPGCSGTQPDLTRYTNLYFTLGMKK